MELRELDVARALLRQTEVLRGLQERDPPRSARLEKLLSLAIFDAQSAWTDAEGRGGRRNSLSAALAEELEVAPPSRLLALLGQALKWQQHTGQLPPNTLYDLFRAAPPTQRDEADLPPSGELFLPARHLRWHLSPSQSSRGWCASARHTRRLPASALTARRVEAASAVPGAASPARAVSHHWLVRRHNRGMGCQLWRAAPRPSLPG